jgi:hypothetical protein
MAHRFRRIDLREPDFAIRPSQHNALDLFWIRELLIFSLSAQRKFMLEAVLLTRNLLAQALHTLIENLTLTP